MKTVAEILKETGLTDEQISALDPKVVNGVTTILSTAQQSLEQAELAKRSMALQYDEQIAPALAEWGNREAQKDAQIAFYKTQLEGAKAGGFVPTTAPNEPPVVTPPRTPDGKFVAGPTGSPEFVQKLRDDIGGAFSFAADTQWKYRKLYGQEMPDSPTAIIREAAAQRMDPVSYAAKKYDFAAKEAEQIKQARQAEIDAAVKDAVAKREKEFAEAGGSNPMVNRAQASEFSKIGAAVKAGDRPSPIGMTREERHRITQQNIQKDMAANAESVH